MDQYHLIASYNCASRDSLNFLPYGYFQHSIFVIKINLYVFQVQQAAANQQMSTEQFTDMVSGTFRVNHKPTY